ncbi:MAG: Flp pilus assembly protein CpaB [Acidimicrobiales bacterium]
MAAALAAVAALSTFSWLRGVEQRAYGDAELVRVFVVAKDIEPGMSGEQVLAERRISEDNIPRKFRPDTALNEVSAIAGLIAQNRIAANTVVLDGMFVAPQQAQGAFAQGIPEGHVAVTVAVDQVRGVAGLFVPGDLVNLMVSDGNGMRLLYQRVQVLAVGRTTTAGADPGADAGGGLVTFAVPQVDAQRIAFAAQQQGGLYLTLVPPGYVAGPIPPVNAGNLFDGPLTPSVG